MLALEFFQWWYSQGWTGSFQRLKHRLSSVTETFSVGILLRTLFSPWRRIITYPGADLSAKLRAVGDNIVSRFVGFSVRIVVLLSALVLSVIVLLVSLFELVVWPLLPPASIGLIITGLLW